jgi:hypothetical protein
MIFTNYENVKVWGRVLDDDDLAQAISDRVLECERVIRSDRLCVRALDVNLHEVIKESDGGDDMTNTTRIRASSSVNPQPQAMACWE